MLEVFLSPTVCFSTNIPSPLGLCDNYVSPEGEKVGRNTAELHLTNGNSAIRLLMYPDVMSVEGPIQQVRGRTTICCLRKRRQDTWMFPVKLQRKQTFQTDVCDKSPVRRLTLVFRVPCSDISDQFSRSVSGERRLQK